MPKAVTIVGLDVSLAATGIAVVDWRGRGRPVLLDAQTIRTKPGQAMPDRLGLIALRITETCERYNPALAAVEAGIVRHSGTTTRLLAQARGAALLALQQAEVPLIEDVHIAQVKRAATGDARASKPEVIAGVVQRVKDAGSLSADEADAVGCCLAVYEKIEH